MEVVVVVERGRDDFIALHVVAVALQAPALGSGPGRCTEGQTETDTDGRLADEAAERFPSSKRALRKCRLMKLNNGLIFISGLIYV